jgi:phosphohistidine swiveling domain-containing protein
MKKKNKINWFWAHRRNASLNQLSFLMNGLAGKGWQPAVNFWFDNQIVVGVPGKGCYIFYDKNQLRAGAKYKDVQQSIDGNPNFVKDFRRRSDEIFGAIFFKCLNIDLENLSLLSNQDILWMYEDFIQTVMVAPIITVQLWGIEACLDENYKIVKFLKNKLAKLGKEEELSAYKNMLSFNTGETVAFTEQKNFYQVAEKLAENQKVKDIFAITDLGLLSAELLKYPLENSLFEKHTQKYEWVNTEYVSGGWSREKWLELFQKAINAEISPSQKLKELYAKFAELNAQREKVIRELKPPAEVKHAIGALAELIAQRDWSKGYFTRALLSYNGLLDEIARRLGVSRLDLLSYSYLELGQAIKTGKPISQTEQASRLANGFVFVIKHGQFSLTTGKNKIKKIIKKEGIEEPFAKLINISEFKGLPASPGIIKAKARVLEDASMIDQLEEGEILVTYMTTIEFVPAFRKAAAVITDEGGMSCHAAIISREFKLPCVVGTKVATRVVQTGDWLEVDANKGIIKILNQ